MPKIYKWGSFSLAELRKVAKAYKEHTKVPAPSKMNKKDLIVLLDKHLLLDKDTAEIKVKATMESSLGAVERLPKKMKKSKVPASPEKLPEPPAEKPKEMTTVEHIQALPKELQDLIFENLPKSQQRDLKEGSETEILDKLEDVKNDLFLAILDQKNIKTMGKSDTYLDKVSDKYNPIADAMLVKWFRKGGEDFARKEAKDFIRKYGF